MVQLLVKVLALALLVVQFAVAIRQKERTDDLDTAIESSEFLPVFSFGGRDTSYEEVGREHGKLAKERIQAFLATDFVKGLTAFRKGNGSAFFHRLVQTNTAAFPEYASEISGIAEGANVASDDIWMLNLMGEIDASEVYKMTPGATSAVSPFISKASSFGSGHSLADLAQSAYPSLAGSKGEHCSTLFGFLSDGDLVLAHNEDWSAKFIDIIYLQNVVYPGGTHLSGFGYPGQILGFAIVANSHGLLFTQNSVWPKEVQDGLSLTLVGRRAMEESTIEAAITRLQDGPQAWGVSVNIISFNEMRGANVELSHGGAGGTSDVQQCVNPGEFLFHYNSFIHLSGVNGMDSATSRDRRAHQNALGPPHSLDELKERMCYKGSPGKLDAIYRPATMMTWLVHVPKQADPSVVVWHNVSACEGGPALEVAWSPDAGIQRSLQL